MFTACVFKSLNNLRVRVGGNSMDDSTYDPYQSQMITNTSFTTDIHDQPVTYGPVLFDVLAELANQVGGIEYLMGKCCN
jgi:hypothetical protein